MFWVPIVGLQRALERLNYEGLAHNNPANCIYISPFSGRPIVVPLNGGDSLPEMIVRHLLRDEQAFVDVTAVISEAME